MTNHLKFARRQTGDGATMVIRADIAPLNAVGNYLIQAEGVSLQSRYSVNRMAKVLFDRSCRGWLEVYGPSADGRRVVLRFSCDIEEMAAWQMNREIRCGSLRRRRADTFCQRRRRPSPLAQIPEIGKRRSLAKGFGGTDAPGTDAAIGDQPEEAAVT